MKVLSWNLRKPGPKRIGSIARAIASAEADIVLLQEVAVAHAATLREQLGKVADLRGWYFSGRPRVTIKTYGNVVAARGTVEPKLWQSAVPLRWPQLLAHAVVTVDRSELEVISVHAPNAAGNGWEKIQTIESVLAKVATLQRPCIVAGDFNEPYRFERGGQPRSFRMQPKEQQRSTFRDVHGKQDDRARWQRAVACMLGSDADAALRHVWFANHDDLEIETHVVRGQSRFFDHILVSRHFEVEDAGFEHEWRKTKLSDHSAAWATLRLRR